MRLDDLARAARDELAASVDALEVPRPASPRRRRTLAFASIAMFVLAAITAATLLARGGDESSRVLATGTASRFFVLDDPTGTRKPVAVLPLIEGDESTAVRFAYFGDATSEDPFESSDALVMVAPVASNISFDDRGESIAVGGGTGRFRADDQAAGFRVNVLGFTDGDQLVSIVSRHLDQAAMVAFADALAVDAASIELTRPVPGLERIGDPTAAPPANGPSIPDARAVTYTGSTGTVTLAVGRGDRDTLRAMRWWDAESTELDGHPAMQTKPATNSTLFAGGGMVWLLEDGTLLSLSATDSSIDVRALAAQVREVRADEWEQLRSTVNPTRPDVSTGPVNATGASAPTATTRPTPILGSFTGTELDATWTLDDHGGSQCLTVRVATLASSSCASGVLPGSAGSTDLRMMTGIAALPLQGRLYFAIPADNGVVALTMVRADGSRIDRTSVGASVDGRALFVGSFPLATDTPTAGRDGIEVRVTYTRRDGTSTSETALMPMLALPAGTTR